MDWGKCFKVYFDIMTAENVCMFGMNHTYIHTYIRADRGRMWLWEMFSSDFKLNLCWWSQCGLTPSIISVFHFLLWNASMKRNILGKWIELSSWKIFKCREYGHSGPPWLCSTNRCLGLKKAWEEAKFYTSWWS